MTKRRIAVALALFLVVLGYSQGSNAFTVPNSQLVVNDPYYGMKFYCVVPFDMSDFHYLGHFPATALLFVASMNESKISNLTTHQIKSGCFFYGRDRRIGCFDKIKGFDKWAEKIKKWDEFEINANKERIISDLRDIYKKYYQEYITKYLAKEYVFVSGEDWTTGDPKSHYQKCKSPKMASISDPENFSFLCHQLFTVSRNSYNFERQELRMGNVFNFQRGYCFYDLYRSMANVPTKDVTLHINTADAKKIFGGSNTVKYARLMTVKIELGSFSDNSSVFMPRMRLTKATYQFINENRETIYEQDVPIAPARPTNVHRR